MTRRTGVIISDLHCGHLAGMTPPAWWLSAKSKTGKIQRELWGYHVKWAEQFHGVDWLIVNGDAIDGKGTRSGGTELITTDRREQCKMAKQVIESFGAKNVLMTYGTPYHTGVDEDWEAEIATALKCQIHGNYFLNPIGTDIHIHFKHKVGSSSIPHGRHTAAAKERMWLEMWREADDWPKANMVVRSHVHFYNTCSGPDWISLTTPAYCGASTKYGSRQCSGVVDFGLIKFEINEKGELRFDAVHDSITVRVRTTKPSIAQL